MVVITSDTKTSRVYGSVITSDTKTSRVYGSVTTSDTKTSRVYGSVTNNNGFWIGFIDAFFYNLS
jgi:hypothetical protein